MTKQERPPDIGSATPSEARAWHLVRSRLGLSGTWDGQVDVDLARVWVEITSGRYRIVETLVTEQRCYVVLEPGERDGAQRRLIAERRVETLEGILLGEGRKALSFRQAIDVRSVTANANHALRGIGCRCLLSRLPMPLFTLVHAAHGRTDLTKGRIGPLGTEESGHRILAMNRVDDCVYPMLSPAEAAVTRLFLAGESHDRIAVLRKTAPRTIANQLTATFHKFGVSGRIELLCTLHVHPLARHLRALEAARHSQPVIAKTLKEQESSGEAVGTSGSQMS